MIVLDTLGRRWFAFAFIAAVLWAARPEGGWRRGFRFIAIASVVSFAAEYVSTHTGFPYGRYDYIAATHGKEVYLSNVPLFVPLSFGCVVWAGRSLALGRGRGRTKLGLVLGAALFATAIDLAIDPVTLRGSRWFLGALYRYRSGGLWFGVPWSNYGGWLLVSAVIVMADEALGSRRAEEAIRRGRALALGICGFFVVLALWTRTWRIALAAVLVTAVIGVASFVKPARTARVVQ